jgi:hypothetical protein
MGPHDCPPAEWAVERENEERAEEEIEEYLNEEFEHSPYDDPAEGYAERTVQCGDLRSGGEDAARNEADRVFEECPYAGRIVVCIAGDTSDSGGAYYFERQEGETVLVDKFMGYEGARGRDAVGYIQDEYNLRCFASYEA